MVNDLTKAELKYLSSLKQKKHRINENKFLIEGVHLVEECLSSDFVVNRIIFNEQFEKKKHHRLRELIKEREVVTETISEKEFLRIAETENSQGVAAEVQMKPFTVEKTGLRFILALDKITDPGNLGTIIRTSYWFGVNQILLSGNSVDIYNPKVIRSTQGAIFHVNIRTDCNLLSELQFLKMNGYKIFLMDIKAKQTLDVPIPGRKNVVVLGNESEGISKEILDEDFIKIKIKSYSNCESLNVAVSCGIALEHFAGNVND